MSSTTAALTELSRMLDGLALLAWLPALAAMAVTLRVLWLECTTPGLALPRWLIPVPLPADLRRVPVAPYGPATRRLAYPGAMRRATLLSALALPALLLTALGLATLMPRPKRVEPLYRLHPTHWEDLTSQRVLEAPPERGGGRRDGPTLKDFFSALIRPTRDRTAPPDSLEILRPEDLAGSSSLNEGPWQGEGNGLNNGPSGLNGTDFDGGTDPEADPDPTVPVIVDEMPVLISLPAPRYPEMARQAGLEGRVVLGLLVGKTGHVEKARILASIPGLDDAALAAGLEARFKPASWQKRPVRVWVELPIRFGLKDAF